MRQAIEEGFILDVLKNYTPYNLAFKIAQDQQEKDKSTVAKKEARKKIMRWVKLNPHNVSQKAIIVVEHFRKNVSPLVGGKAKEMVFVGSRKEGGEMEDGN